MSLFFRSVSFLQNPSTNFFSDAGFTTFSPSIDTSVIYVSDSIGSDSYNGFASAFVSGTVGPKHTVSAGVALLRDGYPDWLLLKRGDIFTGQRFYYPPEGPNNWWKSGRSDSEKMLIGAYGSGRRPIVKMNSDAPATIMPAFSWAPSFIAITDLELTPNQYVGNPDASAGGGGLNNPHGIYWLGNATTKACSSIIIENCYTHGFCNGITLMGNGSSLKHTNFILKRNIIADNYTTYPYNGTGSDNMRPQGVYTWQIDNLLLLENFVLFNGWNEDVFGSSATDYRKNLYISHAYPDELDTGFSAIGNVVLGTDGSQIRSGGLVSGNAFIGGLGCLGVGHHIDGEWDPNGVVSYVYDNIVLDCSSSDKNYGGTITPASAGLTYCFRVGDTINSIVSGNIFVDTSATSQQNDKRSWWVGNGSNDGKFVPFIKNTIISNNIFRNVGTFNWGSPASGYSNNTFSNNDFSWDYVYSAGIFGQHIGYAEDGAIESSFSGSNNNFYVPTIASSQWFSNAGVDQSFSSFTTSCNFTNTSSILIPYSDPQRNLLTYSNSIGLPITKIRQFGNACKDMDKGSWDTRLMAQAINTYIRAGFGR